jgi:hypothetical protein
MKKFHVDMSTGRITDLDDDDPLEGLGLGKRKYLWNDTDSEDAEGAREKQEREVIDRLNWNT